VSPEILGLNDRRLPFADRIRIVLKKDRCAGPTNAVRLYRNIQQTIRIVKDVIWMVLSSFACHCGNNAQKVLLFFTVDTGGNTK
jgi:hypothetical protein